MDFQKKSLVLRNKIQINELKVKNYGWNLNMNWKKLEESLMKFIFNGETIDHFSLGSRPKININAGQSPKLIILTAHPKACAAICNKILLVIFFTLIIMTLDFEHFVFIPLSRYHLKLIF